MSGNSEKVGGSCFCGRLRTAGCTVYLIFVGSKTRLSMGSIEIISYRITKSRYPSGVYAGRTSFTKETGDYKRETKNVSIDGSMMDRIKF